MHVCYTLWLCFLAMLKVHVNGWIAAMSYLVETGWFWTVAVFFGFTFSDL